MAIESWMARWKDLIASKCGNLPILELGCGTGRDTRTLTEYGHRVIALDVSREAIDIAKEICATAEYHHQDMKDDWPVSRNGAGVILASLSLHYFEWGITTALVKRIHDTLKRGGVLICRLNSTQDHEYGSRGYPEISKHFYQVGERTKRFFERQEIESIFAEDWKMINLEEITIDWYEKPKVAWECIVEAM
jgi:SAM-dependent methyltransferase